jgi:hypothetical protein
MEKPNESTEKYAAMQRQGASPVELFQACKRDGHKNWECQVLLMGLFEMTLHETRLISHGEHQSLAELAMRLRRVTDRPPSMCKELLEPLTNEERIAYVEHFETSNATVFIDPIELATPVREHLQMLRIEAEKLRAEGAFGSGMGCGGRINAWIKSEMKVRHSIDWRTPWEMNPGCAFD